MMAIGHDEAHGGAHPCVRRRPAGPQSDRSRPVAGRKGRGDRGATPPAAGPAPAGGPTPLHPDRPDGPRDAGEAATPRSLADLPGHTIDAVSLAPRADPLAVDLPH